MKKSENENPANSISKKVKEPKKPVISNDTQSILSSSSVTKKDAAAPAKSIINTWEKATGHRIKNPEVNDSVPPQTPIKKHKKQK